MLKFSHFDDYVERLRHGGRAALVDWQPELERLEALALKDPNVWPQKQVGTVTLLDRARTYAILGLAMASTNSEAVRSVYEAVRRTAPQLLHPAWEQVYERNRQVNDAPDGIDDEIESMLEGGLMAADSVKAVLQPWRSLWALSDTGLLPHDSLAFDPFAKISISRLAESIGRKPRGRTGTPGPEQWLALLDGSARWVLDYSDPLMTIIEEAREVCLETGVGWCEKGSLALKARARVQAVIDQHWPSSAPPLLLKWRRHTVSGKSEAENSKIPLNEAVAHLAAACLVLVGAFAARRKTELLSLASDCAYQDANRGWWLKVFIGKTIGDIDKMPVPASVGVAVGILELLSASNRHLTGDKWITRILKPSVRPGKEAGTKAFVDVDLGRSRKGFAAILGIPPMEDGTPWSFAAHQLRRGFAIYYYYGNRYANMDALSRFLRHFDPEMTRIYLSDENSERFLRLREVMMARMRRQEEAEARSAQAEGAARAAAEA